MKRLAQRVDDLERATDGIAAITRWHWIIGKAGETQEEARARYERDMEPVGPTEGVIFWNQYHDKGRVPCT